MTRGWEPGTQYDRGDEVEYRGSRYRIIQAHFSQGDWTPDVTPALWGKCPSGGGGEPEHHKWRPGPGNDHQAPTPHYGDQDEKHDHPDKKEHEESWKDKADDFFTDDRKKQLGIAGGVLGAAALIGGGVFAYSKHKSHEEEELKKKEFSQTTTKEAYEKNVELRSEMHSRGDHEQRGQKVFWVPTGGGDIPGNAIRVSEDSNGEPLYACRTFYEGGVHPGKAGKHLQCGAAISYGGREIPVEKYEVLCGERDAITWHDQNGKPRVSGFHPVEAGRESNGTFLFVVLGEHNGQWIPGKVSEADDHALVAYGGEEISVRRFRMAAYQ